MTSSALKRALQWLAVLKAGLIVLLGAALWWPSGVIPAPDDRPAAAPPAVGSRTGASSSGEPAPAPLGPAVPVSAREPDSPAPASNAPAMVYGSIADPKGEAVAEARVALYQADSRERVGFSLLRAGSRFFAMPGLRPGAYHLAVTAAGFEDHERQVEVRGEGDAIRCDVVLEPVWELRVSFVAPDGERLPGALRRLVKNGALARRVELSAIATVEPPPSSLPPTSARQSSHGVGRWVAAGGFGPRSGARLDARHDGLLELPGDQALHVSAVLRTAVLATVPVDVGQAEVSLVVPLDDVFGSLGSVKLRLVDGATGTPVTEARVGVNDAQSYRQGDPVGADGRITLRHLRPGTLYLDVATADRVVAPVRFELAPGQELDFGDLAVHEPVQLHIEADGIGRDAEVSVSLLGLERPPHPALAPRVLRLGRRTLPYSARVAPGRYLLKIQSGAMIGEAVFDTAALVDGVVRAELTEAVVLRVTPPAAASPVRLQLFDSAGRLHYDRWITASRPFDLRLAPGHYSAHIKRGDGDEQRESLHVTTGAALDLR